MQPQHDVCRQRHVVMGLVNEPEPVTVAGDFLLSSVARLHAMDDEIGNPPRRGDHAFDPVGGLHRLNHRVGAERFELLRNLADEQVLPAARLAQAADSAQLGGFKGQLSEKGGLKRGHFSGRGVLKRVIQPRYYPILALLPLFAPSLQRQQLSPGHHSPGHQK